jgi:hypothetical protein
VIEGLLNFCRSIRAGARRRTAPFQTGEKKPAGIARGLELDAFRLAYMNE